MTPGKRVFQRVKPKTKIDVVNVRIFPIFTTLVYKCPHLTFRVRVSDSYHWAAIRPSLIIKNIYFPLLCFLVTSCLSFWSFGCHRSSLRLAPESSLFSLPWDLPSSIYSLMFLTLSLMFSTLSRNSDVLNSISVMFSTLSLWCSQLHLSLSAN